MTIWHITSESLPVIPEKTENGYTNDSVWVQAAYDGSSYVRPLLYARNRYAKTEKGRAPRFEDTHGRIAGAPSVWAYMSLPPGAAHPDRMDGSK
jgi:hypothetical protein